MSAARHEYVSTACWHAQHDNRPDLHASCRSTCKYAPEDGPVEYCRCTCHPQDGTRPVVLPWVDQAREFALSLLAVIAAEGVDLAAVAPDLAQRLHEDPALFWARGEVKPAGTWKPEGER